MCFLVLEIIEFFVNYRKIRNYKIQTILQLSKENMFLSLKNI
jgi:hypothetical protein